jgi:hypothetical protein
MKPIHSVLACLLFLMIGCTLESAGLLSLGLLLIACWLLIAGASLYLSWAVLCRFGLLNRKPLKFLILVPSLLAAFGTSGLLGMMLSTRPARMQSAAITMEEELKYMFEMDQSDRFSGRFILLPGRDQERLARTREIINVSQGSLGAEAKYHAAMILQHGESSSDYESAHLLAASASENGFVGAAKLSEAAYDRWRLSIGQPQKYGTQSRISIGITGIKADPPAPKYD